MKIYQFMALVFIALVTCSNSIQAQQNSKKAAEGKTPEELIEMQIKAVSNQLMLNDKSSKSFISLYGKYLKDLHKSTAPLDKLEKKYEKKGKEYKDLSDKEIEKLLDERMNLRYKQIKIQKKYYNKFKKELTMRQVYKIFNPVFSSGKCRSNDGPILIQNSGIMKPGRIQDKGRLPVMNKKEAPIRENIKN